MSDLFLKDKRMRSETQISEQLDERQCNNRYLLLLLNNKDFNDLTYHNYSNTQMKVYPKNSFDRFGDDLTELIVSYLWFEDKVRLECVSKQWRRLVFNKQFVIEINKNLEDNRIEKHNSMNKLLTVINNKSCVKNQSLESLLKKCSNIKKVILRRTFDSSVLSLIGRYCPNIKSLTYYLKVNDKALSFFQQYGHKLEELNLHFKNEITEQYLRHCPNLKNIFIQDQSFRFPQDMEFLPKLERIKFNITTFPYLNNSNVKDVKIIKNLSDKYSRRLKTLNVTLNKLTEEELKTHIDYICRFENLQSLTLQFTSCESKEPIDDCLSLIGQKCNKILKLDLSIGYGLPISDRFFDTFAIFEDIKKLRINLPIISNTVLSGSVECFKHCKQLIELDINYRKLREDFFANIASFVPKLQSLKIGIDKQFSPSFIKCFHLMKSLKSVEMSYNETYMFKSKTKIWYFSEQCFL